MGRRRPAALLAALAAMLGVTATGSGSHDIGRIKACVFMTYDDVVLSGNVKVQVAGASRAKGTLIFTGAGMHQTIPFKLGPNGIGLTSFPVLQSGTVTILIKLASKPPRTARLGVKLNAANQVTQSSCTPK
jgi:hypothetical protein